MANGGPPNGVNGGANGTSQFNAFNGSAAAALEKGVPIGVAMSGDGELSYRNHMRDTASQNLDTASTNSQMQHYGGNMGTGLPDFFSQEVRNLQLLLHGMRQHHGTLRAYQAC